MALACIQYLSLEEFKNFEQNIMTLTSENGVHCGITHTSFKAISERLPFFAYAARYWSAHARVVESIVVEEIYTMITHIGILQSIASVTHSQQSRLATGETYREWVATDSILVLAEGGLHHTLQRHICDFELDGSHSVSPKKFASAYGSDEAGMIMFGYRYIRAFNSASVLGHTDVLRVILDFWDTESHTHSTSAQAVTEAIERNIVNAAKGGELNVVQLLLDRIVHPHVADKALTAAIVANQQPVMQFLLRHGAKVKYTMYDAMVDDVLIYHDRLKPVRALLSVGCQVDALMPTREACHPNRRMTALQLAATRNHVDMMLLLLEHGADINLRSGVGKRSALEAACRSGSPDAVDLLLAKGACFSKDGMSFAVTGSRKPPVVFSGNWQGKDENGARVLEILRKQGVRITLKDESVYEAAILQTVRTGLPGVLREWLKIGVRFNFQLDENCRTPLLAPSIHLEPYSEHLECIAILLDHGADSSLLNKLLPLACDLDDSERALEMLLAAGMDVHMHGPKALHMQIARTRDRPVKWLLEHGVDANTSCKTYPNPLLTSVATPQALLDYHWSATTRIIKSLIEHGADVQRFGQAALELAKVSYSSPLENWCRRPEDALDQLQELLKSDKAT
jgi:hypothetical protein